MTAESVPTWLYGVSGLAAAALCVPQVVRLWRSADARRALSLAAWGGWSAVGVVGFLYACVVVGEPVMVAVTGANAVGTAAVAAMAAAQRIAARRPA